MFIFSALRIAILICIVWVNKSNSTDLFLIFIGWFKCWKIHCLHHPRQNRKAIPWSEELRQEGKSSSRIRRQSCDPHYPFCHIKQALTLLFPISKLREEFCKHQVIDTSILTYNSSKIKNISVKEQKLFLFSLLCAKPTQLKIHFFHPH